MDGPELTQEKLLLADIVRHYAELRTAVAYLGETSESKWWDTSYLNEVGRKYLELNFPRTSLAAGVNGAGLAAKRLHDERIGRARVFHLFRFPYDLEERVHDALISADQKTMWASISSPEGALEVLRGYVESELDVPDGPVQVGVEGDIATPRGLSEIASHYLSAFESGRMSLPYFRAEADAE